jgi:hypothetical protein
VSPVRFELGSYIKEDYILDSHRRENLKSHMPFFRPQVRRREREGERETCTLLGPLERANLIHWTLCFLIFRIADDGQVQKPSNSEFYLSSLEAEMTKASLKRFILRMCALL